MKIQFFKPKGGHSIRNVFIPIIEEVNKTSIVLECELLSNSVGIKDILQNGLYVRNKQQKGFINHITGAEHFLLLFLNGKRTVVTVHDIMHYFELHGIKKWLWKLLYIYPLKLAAKVVFISEFAKGQTLKEVKLDNYCIIENPLLPEFQYVPKAFNQEKPRIMHIGTVDRKNLSRTIQALKGISCHLRIIGTISEENRKLLVENEIDYSNEINISNEEVRKEYELCDIVNFPSTFEGFGMPIIEGQKVGRVVLTSNISPMKDVAGDGAVLVNPFEVNSIREGYMRILAMSDEERQNLINKGLKNCERFSAKNIAKQYLDVYSEIINKRNE